jgi:F-type H+-transporting ATPase subunit epsilon
MANTMAVELVSPERVLFSGSATMVVVRTLDGGDIAFLPGHAPFLGALGERDAHIALEDGSVQWVAVHGGFVEVSNNKVTILSDRAELAQDIDLARAETAKAEAEELLRTSEDEEVQAMLRRATARINAFAGHAASMGAAARPATSH